MSKLPANCRRLNWTIDDFSIYRFPQLKINERYFIILRQLAHCFIIKVWETGGHHPPHDPKFEKRVHVIVRNVDRKSDYEFDQWPHFKLSI